MSKKVGESMHGVIATVRPEGFLVRCLEIPAEGFVAIESLPDDRYRYDRQTHTIEGFRSGNRFRLGDELVVQVAKVDLARRDLQFLVVRKTAEASIAGVEKGRSHFKQVRGAHPKSSKRAKKSGMHRDAKKKRRK